MSRLGRLRGRGISFTREQLYVPEVLAGRAGLRFSDAGQTLGEAMRRALIAAVMAVGMFAANAAAQPATIGEALACESASNQPACLLRAGARGWSGDTDHSAAVMTAILHFRLDDPSLGLGPDRYRTFAAVRALAEAVRLEAAGESPSRVLAPIARLPRDEREDAYRLFAYGPGSFVLPLDVWRPRTTNEETIRMVLRTLELDRSGLSRADIRSLASAYASHSMVDEGRSLLRRHNAEDDATAFWYTTGDFAAAERAMRADGDVHPVTLIYVASAAAEAGDHARSARLAMELLDTFVRGHGSRLIVAHDPTKLAESAARILSASGQAEQARGYALALMDGQTPDGALFGSHAGYAIAILTAIGDFQGACSVARTLAAGIDTPLSDGAAGNVADEPAIRAREAAVALARCGDGDAARAIAARHGVQDFWLTFYLGDSFAGMAPPNVGGLGDTIENELAAGRNERASQLMQVLFESSPAYATGIMHGDEPWNAVLLQAWRNGGAFAALHEALLRENRIESEVLTDQDREYVFAAALMLADEP